VTLAIACRACGSNRIAFNHAVSDACVVTCENCGSVEGTFGELKQRVVAQLGRRD